MWLGRCVRSSTSWSTIRRARAVRARDLAQCVRTKSLSTFTLNVVPAKYRATMSWGSCQPASFPDYVANDDDCAALVPEVDPTGARADISWTALPNGFLFEAASKHDPVVAAKA